MTVVSEKGKFNINGKDVFLYGGELHYFRVPKKDWSKRLDLLIEAGCNLVSTYVPWALHEYEEGKYDLNGKTAPETDLKAFLDLVHEKGLYCIVRPGPYIMAEVRYEGIPDWLLDSYPDIVAKQRNGEEHLTRVVSYQHPVFLKKVEAWYRQVNQVIAPMQLSQGGSIIMYQLCNEIGMLHWVTNTSDYNADTLKHFKDYLEQNYDDIHAFNAYFHVEEGSFDRFIERFQKGLPSDYPSFHFVWLKFWREYIKDYVGILRHYALDTGIDVPFIINVHGFKDFSVYSRGVDYPIGLSQLYATADFEDTVLAGDFYPGHIGYDTYHDLVLSSEYTKSISRKDQPLFSAEFQSGRLADRPRLYPQDLDLNTRTCVAHDMNALNYYMFAAGENPGELGLFGRRHEWQAPIDSTGKTRPNYDKAKHLGHLFNVIGEQLLDSSKHVQTYVGFNPDDYMTEVVDDRDKPMVDEIAAKREMFGYDGILRLLTAANIHYNAVDLLKPIDPSDYPSLWVFSTQYMNDDLQQKLADYVKNGGDLILYPEIPTKDHHARPCTILTDQLMLGEWEVVNGNDYVDVLDMDSINVKQRLKFTQFDGQSIARFTRKQSDETAAYIKNVGKGRILVLGLGMGHDYNYQLDVIKNIAQSIGINSDLILSNPDVSVTERKNDHGTSFYFVHNYDEIEQRTAIYKRDEALFGGDEVVLPPRSGAILIENYPLVENLKVIHSTVEMVRLEHNDDEIALTVRPIGPSGVIKLEDNQHWVLQSHDDLENITDETTLFFQAKKVHTTDQ